MAKPKWRKPTRQEVQLFKNYRDRFFADTSLSRGQALLALKMAELAGPTGCCYASHRALGKMIGNTEEYVKEMIGNFIESGDIELVKKGGGRGNPNWYRPCLEPVSINEEDVKTTKSEAKHSRTIDNETGEDYVPAEHNDDEWARVKGTRK